MANDVFANGLEIACKAADGKSVAAFPDPCWTPPSPNAGWILIPYANTAYARDTANASKTVFISGKPVMKKDQSYFKTSFGNEPAAGPKGKSTGVKKGKAYFTSWSMNVKVEGMNVDRHTDGMTHNHGSFPGNTTEWRYLDTASKKNCTDEIAKVKKVCGEKKNKKKSKKKTPDKSKHWKEKHCSGLTKKPRSISLDELNNIIDQAQEKLDALDAIDAIKEKVADAIEEKVLNKTGKMLAKKPIQAILGPLGWAWAAYDVIDGARDAKELYDYLDEVKAAALDLKTEVQQMKGKLDQLQTALESGNVKKASAMMADMQKNIALLDACTRARKCMLVPHGDTAKRTQGNEKNDKGCCPGQTGHHMIPDGYMNGKSICSGYTSGSAPTVCVEGTTQYHGSHHVIHRALETAIRDEVSGNHVEYEDARDASLKAHKKTFPLSECSDKCLKAQLDNYYHERCKEHEGFFGGDPNPELGYCKICPQDAENEEM